MNAIVFIPLTQGKVAVVDFEDFEKVRGFKWYAHKSNNTFYAARNVPRNGNTKRAKILMHNFLLGGPADHIDGNGLDNQAKNTRLATNQQNRRAFETKSTGCSSRYRGVSWRKDLQKWHARITLAPGKLAHLGYFESEIEAAGAFDTAALARDPKFHHLNFPVNI